MTFSVKVTAYFPYFRVNFLSSFLVPNCKLISTLLSLSHKV
jgi:hypothetical protein